MFVEKLEKKCLRKRRYDDEVAALAEMNFVKTQPDVVEPERLRTYKCQYCEGWHFGHDKVKNN